MDPIADLRNKLADYKKKGKVKYDDKQATSLSPFRICVEIVSAIIVGLIIGNIIDHLAGTKLTFKIIFLILGCIASFRIIYKLANEK